MKKEKYHHSQETKDKMSKAKMGNTNACGTRSQETKDKMSKAQTGKKHSQSPAPSGSAAAGLPASPPPARWEPGIFDTGVREFTQVSRRLAAAASAELFLIEGICN